MSPTSSTVAIVGSVSATFSAVTVLTGKNQATASTVDLATITAGKTGYIIGFSAYVNGAGYAQLMDNDGHIFWKMYNGAAVGTYNIMFPQGQNPTVAATKKIQVSAEAATNCTITAWYYEEPV